MRNLKITLLSVIMIAGCKSRQFDKHAISDTKDNPLVKRVLDSDDVFKIAQCKTHLNENNIEFKKGRLEIVFSQKRSQFFSQKTSERLKKTVKLGYLTFEGALGFDGKVSPFTHKQFFNLFDLGWSLVRPPLVSRIEKNDQGLLFHFFSDGCDDDCGNTITIRADDDSDHIRFESAVKLILGEKTVTLETIDSNKQKEEFRFTDCKIQKENVKKLEDSLF